VARELRARGELSPAAAAELADREAELHYDGHRAPRARRGAGLRRRGELPASAVAELADREAALAYDGRHAPRPRRSAALRRLARRLRRPGGS